MTSIVSLAVITTLWGVVMAVSPVLQIRTIRRTGTSLGVSALQVGVIFLGNGLWLAYGLTRAVPPLIIVNVIALVANGVWLVYVVRFRPPPEGDGVDLVPAEDCDAAAPDDQGVDRRPAVATR
jgi:uncharacterized protein with PQ loop repeat